MIDKLQADLEARDQEIATLNADLAERAKAADAGSDPFDALMDEWSTSHPAPDSAEAVDTDPLQEIPRIAETVPVASPSPAAAPATSPLAADTSALQADLTQLRAECEARRLEVEDLTAQLVDAQNFRKQIQSFLRGLGIRLPN